MSLEFLIIRYGYRPIPSEIDTAELELLREALVQMGNDVHLLDKWYRKDSNKVTIYILLFVWIVVQCYAYHKIEITAPTQ